MHMSIAWRHKGINFSEYRLERFESDEGGLIEVQCEGGRWIEVLRERRAGKNIWT
jgi:hypothetical protein